MIDRVAVLIPCLNEEKTVGQVVTSFRQALPTATIYVYDNGSTDGTALQAAAAGAAVRKEPQRGKGNVVRRMLADIDADIYVLVDGDATYEAADAPAMIETLRAQHLDMVTAVRAPVHAEAYRIGHTWGNLAFTSLVGRLFGRRCGDLFSGYRLISRRLAKSFPALATGFEIEIELTVHALALGLPMADVPSAYYARPKDSASKLDTYGDGLRIARRLLSLVRTERPIMFFGTLGGAAAALSVILAVPLLETYVATGLVPRYPTAILSTGLMLSGFIALGAGVVLQSVARLRREMLRLSYLQQPARP